MGEVPGQVDPERPAVRSRFGLVVVELEALGWPLARIGRHIGCDQTFVTRMRDDPGCVPRWTVGEALFELRDSAITGLSRWSRIILALRAHGYTTAKIADACSVTIRAICELENDPTRIPTHDTGDALLALYRRAVQPLKGA